MTIPAQALEIDRAAAKAAGYTDAEIDAFLASGGRQQPTFAADATAVQPVDFGVKYGGARAMKPGEGMVRQMARGATFGASDRGLAALVAGLDPKVDYDSARTRIDNENRRYEAENPALSLLWNTLGGSPAKAPANALMRTVSRGADDVIRGTGKVANLAKGTGVGMAGGMTGAVGYQRGDADKSMEQTIKNALFGAATGGAIGGPGAALAKGAGGIAADLTGARNVAAQTPLGQVPTNPARGTANPLTREFWSGDNAKNLLQRGEGLLYPTQAPRMVDQRMLGVLTDDGRSNLASAASDFQALDDLTGNAMVLDVTGNKGLRLARGTRGVGERAAGTFDDAFSARTATLGTNMENDVAETLARRENVPRGVAARREQRSANARAAYEPVMGDVVPLSDDLKMMMVNDPQNLYQKAYEAGRVTRLREDPRRQLDPLFGDVDDGKGGTMLGMVREPTVEDIDMIKKGLDVVINDRNAASAANTRYDARLIRGQLDRLLAAADNASPGYAAARQQFGDDSEMIEAFQGMAKGVSTPFRETPSFSRATPDEVEDFFSRLSSAGKSEGQRGIAQDMYRMIDQNASRTLNDAASPVRSGLRRKLDLAFADKPDAARELTTRWNARDAQQKNQQFVTGGSPTAEKLLDQVEAASLPGRVGQITYAPDRALMALLGEANIRRLGRTMSDEMAQRMTLGGEEGAQYIGPYLREFQNTLRNRTASRRAGTGRLAGQGIGMREAIAALFGGEEY